LDTLRTLKFLNYLLGTTLVVSSLYIYLTRSKTIPLYISLAIIIAGPLEDALIGYIEKSPNLSPGDKEQFQNIVDNITSLTFLIFLGIAVLETANHK